MSTKIKYYTSILHYVFLSLKVNTTFAKKIEYDQKF